VQSPLPVACSVLQCVCSVFAVCCSVFAVSYDCVVPHGAIALACGVQRVAVYCSVFTVCCTELQCACSEL